MRIYKVPCEFKLPCEFIKYHVNLLKCYVNSLMLPDPLCTGVYRLEIISAALRGSGTVYSSKNLDTKLVTIDFIIKLAYVLVVGDQFHLKVSVC